MENLLTFLLIIATILMIGSIIYSTYLTYRSDRDFRRTSKKIEREIERLKRKEIEDLYKN